MRSIRSVLLLSTIAASATASSEVNCVTALGPKPVNPIETVTAESTSTFSLPDATTTTSVTETSTAAPVTETETTTLQVTTTTTESTVTETYTSTSTETDTSTTTTTSVTTETETVNETVTTTTTSTVGAPSGFVPISDTLNGFPARKRDSHRRHCHKASLSEPAPYSTAVIGSYTTAQASPSDGACTVGEGTQSPSSVQCSVTSTTQATVTETETITSTTTPAPVTETETETATSTSTEVPSASTTVIQTETITATATATETSTTTESTTSTSTETATASVVYEGCGNNNILSNYQGRAIGNVFNNGNGQLAGATILDSVNANSPVDCCQRCFDTAGCTGSIFPYPQGRSCYLMHNAQRSCVSQSANQALFVTNSGTSGFTLSNGPCGYQEYRAT